MAEIRLADSVTERITTRHDIQLLFGVRKQHPMIDRPDRDDIAGNTVGLQILRPIADVEVECRGYVIFGPLELERLREHKLISARPILNHPETKILEQVD